jgi:hypothetical protein
METRLKEPGKPMLAMGLCSQRLAGMLGAPSVVIVYGILIIWQFRNYQKS